MNKNTVRMLLVFSILIFLFGINVISATGPVPSRYGEIIIVDDEGDGDYSTLKEAVNNSNPGDTIEVYSGTYNEHSIYMEKKDVSIIGIPYELGNGNDSGKPFINTGDSKSIFIVTASGVVITNFKMYMDSGETVIKIEATNCIVSNNNITGGEKVGSAVDAEDSSKFHITGNEFKNFKIGIWIKRGENFNISHNVLQNCDNALIHIRWETTGYAYSIISHNTICNGPVGIEYSDSKLIISYNKITGCEYGIYTYGPDKPNRILHNEIRDCDVGVIMSITSLIGAPKLKHNNLIDNLKNIFFHQLLPIRYSRFFNPILFKNYYDDWSGNGPYWVLGSTGVLGPLLPWIIFDWFPAKEPYYISEAENASVVVKAENSKIKITLTTGGNNYPSTSYSFANSVTIRVNGTAMDENNLEGNTGWEVGESLYIGGSTPILDDDESSVGQLGPGTYSITIIIIETVIFDDSITIV